MLAIDLLPKKTCSKCRRRRSISRFYGDARRPDGLQSCCRKCSGISQRRTVGRRAEHYRAYGLAWNATHKLVAKDYALKRHFGIDLAEYQRLLDLQGGCCAICLKPHAFSKQFHVDHDHDTGRIRGILCHGCNTGIGLLGESPDRLAVAGRYLTGMPLHAVFTINAVEAQDRADLFLS